MDTDRFGIVTEVFEVGAEAVETVAAQDFVGDAGDACAGKVEGFQGRLHPE
jgi:hypothetical protein